MSTVRKWCSVLVLAGITAAAAHAAPTKIASTEVHPGIVRETWRDDAIPAVLHLVMVDLTSAEIGVYATREDQRGRTTSSYASAIGAQVAVNGDLFAIADYRPRGLAWGDMPWSGTADDSASALFHLRRAGERTLAAIESPETINAIASLPAGTQGAIGGRPLLVRSGAVNNDLACSDPFTVGCGRAPRTALGLSADGNTLYIAVVDGWQLLSLGTTAAELAAFLRARGAYAAVAVDGGASSTLVIDGELANAPSDGVERTVANHLGIKYGALPRGQLVGLICKNDIFACRDDASQRIPGAEVTLDDGRVQVVGADAFYNFTDVTPRLACVTVRKAGYLTARKCDIVESGREKFNSVALVEGMDPPVDAGVPDAPGPDDDAGITDDGGVAGDAGIPASGDGGGCCSAHGSDGGPIGSIVLAALVAWRPRRRRIQSRE